MRTDREALHLFHFMKNNLAERLASKNVDFTALSIDDVVRVFVDLYEDRAPDSDLLATLLFILNTEYGLLTDADIIQEVIPRILDKIHEILDARTRPDMQRHRNNLDDLSGEEFEGLIARLLRKMGLNATVTQRSRDGGIDIIATTGQSIFSGKYLVQCKRWAKPIGEPTIRDLFGVVSSERANKGILITTSTFTDDAHRFASGKPLELIEREQLLTLLDEHGLLPEPGGSIINEPDEWQIYRGELLRDPNNLRVRLRFIFELAWELRQCRYGSSRSHLLSVAGEYESNLEFLTRLRPAGHPSRAYVKYVSYVKLGIMRMLRGNIVEAIRNIWRVREVDGLSTRPIDSPAYDGPFDGLFVTVILTMLPILSMVGDHATVDRLFSKYRKRIDNHVLLRGTVFKNVYDRNPTDPGSAVPQLGLLWLETVNDRSFSLVPWVDLDKNDLDDRANYSPVAMYYINTLDITSGKYSPIFDRGGNGESAEQSVIRAILI